MTEVSQRKNLYRQTAEEQEEGNCRSQQREGLKFTADSKIPSIPWGFGPVEADHFTILQTESYFPHKNWGRSLLMTSLLKLQFTYALMSSCGDKLL